jgi:NADPH:quinone reductase-like Zn-dependent oxidoreductase
LKNLSDRLRPTIAFECVGGEMTGIILASIKENGLLYHYGNLSLRPISNVQTRDLVFKNKTMKGFWLPSFLNSLSSKDYSEIFNELIDLKCNSDTFNTNIIDTFHPKDVDVAIKTYRKEMGKGKIILDFSK